MEMIVAEAEDGKRKNVDGEQSESESAKRCKLVDGEQLVQECDIADGADLADGAERQDVEVDGGDGPTAVSAVDGAVGQGEAGGWRVTRQGSSRHFSRRSLALHRARRVGLTLTWQMARRWKSVQTGQRA